MAPVLAAYHVYRMSTPSKLCERPVHSGPVHGEFFGYLSSRATAIGEREDLICKLPLASDGFRSPHHCGWGPLFAVFPSLVGSPGDEQPLSHLITREAELFSNRNQSGAIIIRRHGPSLASRIGSRSFAILSGMIRGDLWRLEHPAGAAVRRRPGRVAAVPTKLGAGPFTPRHAGSIRGPLQTCTPARAAGLASGSALVSPWEGPSEHPSERLWEPLSVRPSNHPSERLLKRPWTWEAAASPRAGGRAAEVAAAL